MSAEALHLAVIAVVGLAVAYKAADLLRAPRPGHWALWSALLALLLALAVGLRTVGGVLDAVLPGAGWIVQHELVVGGTFALQAFFVHSTHPPHRVPAALRSRAALTGTGMVVLFAAWLVAALVESPDWSRVDWGRQPWTSAANLLFVLGVAGCLLVNARLTAHWARIADRRWLRRGLWLLTTGGWCCVAWAGHRACFILGGRFGTPPPWKQTFPELTMLAIGLSTAIVGITLPAWGPRVDAARTWLAHYRSYRRLTPLWHALRTATPTIELRSPTPWWHMEYRLYRRVIEIWDGRAALRPYRDPTPGELCATAEAESLRAALRAKLDGADPHPTPAPETHRGTTDLAAEVGWLESVAAAGDWRSPILS
ncbi:MAB_1171c family putative transporter [Actinokineospora spheciospongiae]|uniref:MAB_1171c family putative transporter n=1 Tax=Actinokineospora spheciospongiae TaxID=909613 RepID=UPI000D714547|nr:MAB_1171c family putative transporter [Actinokineospora spheciospongiae]PWW56954.1 hypothetical protein DFQ13_110156 [Actinokineospora spheciospongiae]